MGRLGSDESRTMDDFTMSGRGSRDESRTVEMPREKKSSIIWILVGIGGVLVLALCAVGVFALFKYAASDSQTSEPGNVLPQPANEDSVITEPPMVTEPPVQMTSPVTEQPIMPKTVPGFGDKWISPVDGMTMLAVPSGEFIMGSNEGYQDEKPPHKVVLASYWIDQTEVTNTMYAKCVQSGECKLPSNTRYYDASKYADHPVVYVNWSDSENYCEWRGARLPSESEWEKAASWDDKKKEKRIYPWGMTINCSLANYSLSDNTCVGRTTKVGRYTDGGSFYGLLDMAGNVWEWVADFYNAYENNPVSRREYGMTYRVVRGGSWFEKYNCLRSSCRGWITPDYRDDRTGFRCAMDANE
jgi:formylglycine-generating enzyme required for sulfatase activity